MDYVRRHLLRRLRCAAPSDDGHGDPASLDEAVRAGRLARRGGQGGVSCLLREERDREIAESYRRAYSEHPQEDWIGEVGAALLAEAVVAEGK